MMTLDLNGKSALVGGSSKGIGKACAIALSQCGATVTLVARNEQSLMTVLDELDRSQGQQHDFIIADYSKPKDLQEAILHQLHDTTYQILINNTAGPSPGSIVEATIDQFEATFRNHLECNHLLTISLLEGMKKSNYGRIINIISTSVKIPIRNLGVSNTIRAAVANWAKTLATELAPFGITVNNILPGSTNTDRLQEINEANAAKFGRPVEEITRQMLREIPMERFAEPGEVAAAVAFLASPLASYITGINLPVDGGRTGCL